MRTILICMLVLLPTIYAEMPQTLDEKLELRINFHSNGETILSQLKRLQQDYKLNINLTGIPNETLMRKTKKYSYVNAKIKYILRRIASEAQSIYEVNTFVLQFKQEKANI